MRLSILDHGHRRRVKLFLALTSATSRVDSPDIVKMLLYRPGLLTRPLLELTADAMRGPSYWTAGEREYLAMCTARLHQCPFCIDTHAELTRIAGHGEIDPDDPESARPQLRAVRRFLEPTSLTPDRSNAAEATAGLADVPEHALQEALRVNLVWNIVNRLANAFGFTLREGQLHSGTRALHRFGYRFPSSCSPTALRPATATPWPTCAGRCWRHLPPPIRRCAPPQWPVSPFPNPGSHTPRPSVRPRTGSPKRTWTGSPPTGARKTRSSRSPSRPPSARHCTASTPAGTHWRA